jgi:hypothetical protein
MKESSCMLQQALVLDRITNSQLKSRTGKEKFDLVANREKKHLIAI